MKLEDSAPPVFSNPDTSMIAMAFECIEVLYNPEPDKPEPKRVAVFVGRMSAALSDMEVSEGAALFRPTAAQFLSRFDMI